MVLAFQRRKENKQQSKNVLLNSKGCYEEKESKVIKSNSAILENDHDYDFFFQFKKNLR